MRFFLFFFTFSIFNIFLHATKLTTFSGFFCHVGSPRQISSLFWYLSFSLHMSLPSFLSVLQVDMDESVEVDKLDIK